MTLQTRPLRRLLEFSNSAISIGQKKACLATTTPNPMWNVFLLDQYSGKRHLRTNRTDPTLSGLHITSL